MPSENSRPTEDWEFWPDHAYVPGRTARHNEADFDAIKETAKAGLSADSLAASHAFLMGLRYLDRGFFWEAHEVFEPIWMVLPEPSRERQFVQGLIQIANGFLKLEMERPKAAARLAKIARELVPQENQGAIMGVELMEVHEMIERLKESVKNAL